MRLRGGVVDLLKNTYYFVYFRLKMVAVDSMEHGTCQSTNVQRLC